MNRYQSVAVRIAAINLLLILLFPPFDVPAVASAFAPPFAGFFFVLNPPAFGQINFNVLTLELMVVLVNTGIAWLLLRNRAPDTTRPRLSLQNAVLLVTAVNLVLMLLFPPFATVQTLTNPLTPSFEGFYFILSQEPNYAIATGILYMEVAFILINGGLFWLAFNQEL